MPWALKLRFELPFLEGYIDHVRRFLKVSRTQIQARIIRHNDEVESKDLAAGLLNTKDPKTGKQLTTAEVISKATLLLIAGK